MHNTFYIIGLFVVSLVVLHVASTCNYHKYYSETLQLGLYKFAYEIVLKITFMHA